MPSEERRFEPSPRRAASRTPAILTRHVSERDDRVQVLPHPRSQPRADGSGWYLVRRDALAGALRWYLVRRDALAGASGSYGVTGSCVG